MRVPLRRGEKVHTTKRCDLFAYRESGTDKAVYDDPPGHARGIYREKKNSKWGKRANGLVELTVTHRLRSCTLFVAS